MTFIRCNSGTSSCALYLQSLIGSGTPTIVSTAVPLLQPNPVSGEASRPMINPNPTARTQALYVGTDNHIHLVSLTSPPGFAERDLSNESGIPSGKFDEYPDWSPDGMRIIFDRSHSVYVLDPTAGPATACALWGWPTPERRSSRSSPRRTSLRHPATRPRTVTCGPSSVVEAISSWTRVTVSAAP